MSGECDDQERLRGSEQEFNNAAYNDKNKRRVKDQEMQYDVSLLSDQGKYKAIDRRKKKMCYACVIMVLILILATCIAALVTLALHAHNKTVEHVEIGHIACKSELIKLEILKANISDESSEVNAMIYIVNFNYTDQYSDVLTETSKQLTTELMAQLDKVFNNMAIGNDLSHVAVNQIRKGSIVVDITFYFSSLHVQLELQSLIIESFRKTVKITRDQKCYLGRFQIDIYKTVFTAIRWNGTTATSVSPSTTTGRSTTLVTGPPATCEPINNRLCLSDQISYDQTGFPNYMGHKNQTETDSLVHQLHFFLMGACYPYGKQFVCSVLTPKCENNALVPPCRQMCEDFYKKCRSSVPDGFSHIDCSTFPDQSSGSCISAPSLPGMNVRLKPVPGGIKYSGTVEVEYFPNHWITLCGHAWSQQDGDVICRQLHYSDAKKTWTQLDHSDVMTFIYGANCVGTEMNLGECELMMSSDVPMPCDNVAMVECENQGNDLADLRLRLGGGTSTAGLLEVYHQGSWGTVCDDMFGVEEAVVACRMMGFSTKDANVIDGSTFGKSAQPILLDDVDCIGTETNLGLCKHKGWGSTNCIHKEDVAISCTVKGPDEKPTTNSVTKTTKTTTPRPELVEMRLVGGKPFQTGRLEIRMKDSDEWGTVCRALFDDRAANVFCKMMGYQSGLYKMATYGPGDGPIVMNYIHCDGTESNISQCNYDVDTQDCTHTDDVSISCHSNY